jgi:hypothetical protein
MIPEPVTPLSRDFGRRAQSVFDLEKTLIGFLTRLFTSARLDNPTLNLAQPAVVPFDTTARAQTLDLKVAPRIDRGRVPRTVTGEIATDRLPDCPSIIVQAIAGNVRNDETVVTVRMLFSAYDESPDGGGYQDVLNMIEAAALALTSFGQAGIDKSYPIILPIDWKLIEGDTLSHFIGEMTTNWELPSARPMPDAPAGIIPAETLHTRIEHDMEARIESGGY